MLKAMRSSNGVSVPAVRTLLSAAPPSAMTARKTSRMPPK